MMLLMLVAFLILPLHAEEPAKPVTDPTQVAAAYKKVLARPEFIESAQPDISSHLKDVLSQWFLHLGAKFGEFKYADRMPQVESLLVTILITICLGSLLYIISRLRRRRRTMERDREMDAPGSHAFRPPEFYDREIEDALRSSDWHGAWLAGWRQFLARLEHRHLVEDDRTQTNREYLAQLRDKTLPAPALTLLVEMVETYDRVIYGRRTIGEPEWTLFHRQLNEATLLLHLDEKAPAKTERE